MHVNRLLLHVFHRKKVLIICIALMEMSYGNNGGSGSIFWTAEYQNMSFEVCIMQSMDMFLFFLQICHCVQSPAYILQCIYFRVYSFDNLLRPMRQTLKKCHCVCIIKR